VAARGAGAQQGRLPVIGVLRPNPKDVNEIFAEPFRRYMKAIGWEEGHLQEISGSTRLRGGAGRTRTSNQAIMSERLRLPDAA
jgi:hypothetical protein